MLLIHKASTNDVNNGVSTACYGVAWLRRLTVSNSSALEQIINEQPSTPETNVAIWSDWHNTWSQHRWMETSSAVYMLNMDIHCNTSAFSNPAGPCHRWWLKSLSTLHLTHQTDSLLQVWHLQSLTLVFCNHGRLTRISAKYINSFLAIWFLVIQKFMWKCLWASLHAKIKWIQGWILAWSW